MKLGGWDENILLKWDYIIGSIFNWKYTYFNLREERETKGTVESRMKLFYFKENFLKYPSIVLKGSLQKH